MEFLDGLNEHLLVFSFGGLELRTPVTIVVVDEPGVGGFSLFSIRHPLVTFLKYFFSLEVEVSLDDSLETLRWVPELLNHREFDVGVTYDVGVGFVFAFAFLGTSFTLESWFIEVDLLTHDDGLC